MADTRAALDFEVTQADTANALMSGDLPVLATPRLIAWLEAATCEAVRVRLEPGQTTVGTRVVVDHEAPSRIGARVVAAAWLSEVNDRTLTFGVEASDAGGGQILARGVITRVVVDEERFMRRLAPGSST